MNFLTVLFVLLVATTIAFADMAPVSGTGTGSLRIYTEPSVELSREKILIEIGKKSAHVPVRYVFNNSSDAPVTLTTGFPERLRLSDEDYASKGMKNFVARVNEKTIHTRFQSTGTSSNDWTSKPRFGWHVYPVTFLPGETVIENRYTQYYFGVSKDHALDFEYILDTGASWKGEIGTVDVQIDFVDGMNARTVKTLPLQGSLWTTSPDFRHLHKTLTNIEPTQQENITLHLFSNLVATDPLGLCGAKGVNPDDSPMFVGQSLTDLEKEYNAKDSIGYQEGTRAFDFLARPVRAKDYEGKTTTGFDAFVPCFINDWNDESAWISKISGASGNAFLSIPLETRRELIALHVQGGFTKGQNRFLDYARPKKIRLTLYGERGEQIPFYEEEKQKDMSYTLTLSDSKMGQKIDILNHPEIFIPSSDVFTRLRVDILSVYPGKKYPQVAITDFSFESVPQGASVSEKYAPLVSRKDFSE